MHRYCTEVFRNRWFSDRGFGVGKSESTQRVSLTTPIVRALEAPATGRTDVYDSKLPGLALCITAKGTRTFYLCQRVHGRPQRIVLGKFPLMTLEQARDRA